MAKFQYPVNTIYILLKNWSFLKGQYFIFWKISLSDFLPAEASKVSALRKDSVLLAAFAKLFFPTQKYFLCQTVIWNNVLTQKIHVRCVLHLYTVKRPVHKKFWGPRGWHWTPGQLLSFHIGGGDTGRWQRWYKSTGISRTMTRTASLPGLQDGEAGMLGSDIRSPCREGCREGKSAPHYEEEKKPAAGWWCPAMGQR